MLGEDIVEKQKAAMPSLETNWRGVTKDEWLDIVKAGIGEKGWAPMEAFLAAVDAKVAATASGGTASCEALAKKVYNQFDQDWCETKNTGAIAVPAEAKELGDQTDLKAKALLKGLAEDKKLSVDEWIAHCTAMAGTLGAPRVNKCLSALSSRLDKVKEMDDAMGGF